MTTQQENAYKIFDPTNKKGVIDILPKYQVLAFLLSMMSEEQFNDPIVH